MNIIAAVDFSPVTGAVLDVLEEFAASIAARVWLVHVVAPDPAFVGYEAGPGGVRNQVAAEHRKHHQDLQHLAERLRAAGIETTALLLQGPTVETIISEAGRLPASLIVLGSHGHGRIYDVLVGSVSEGIVRASKVPVLLVPAQRGT